MKIAISIDSACDMPKEIIEKENIYMIPYFVNMGDKEYRDGIDITTEDLFKYAKETGKLAKTGAISVDEFKEYFLNLLKDNDAVIHFSLSGEITSACEHAQIASVGLNVKVIDSKSLSSGIALLVLSAVRKIKEGKSLDQIVEEINAEREKVQASFLVDTLKYLHKGGRCSSIAAIGAKLLMIKPKILVKDGKMTVVKKYMGGINSCLLKYVEDTLKMSNPDTTVAFCTHSSKMEISRKICDRLKEYGFKEVYDCDASSTISTHCGPNTLGILFINK